MMNALKEYNEMVWKPSWKWLKKHWKFYTMFCVFIMAIELCCLYWSSIKRFVKSKFKRNKEES